MNEKDDLDNMTVIDTKEEEIKGASDAKTVTDEFMGSFGAHGLPRVWSSASPVKKIVWLVLFLAASGYCLNIIIRVGIKFGTFPSGINSKVYPRSIVDFPAVTICNLNMLKATSISNNNVEKYINLLSVQSEAEASMNSWITWALNYTDSVTTSFGPTTDSTSRTNSSNAGTTDHTTVADRRKRAVEEFPFNEDLLEDELLLNLRADHVNDLTRLIHMPEVVKMATLRLLKKRHGFDMREQRSAPPIPHRQKRDNQAAETNSSDYYDDNFYYYDNYDYSYYDDYGFGDVSENDFRTLLTKSKTDDYQDLMGVLKPTKTELELYGHSAQDMIVSCTFDSKKCNYTLFKTFQNSYYGNCFTFNYDDGNSTTQEVVFNTTKKGSRFGLKLTLNIERQEYIGLFAHGSGVRVAVHPRNATPFPEDYGISAPTGWETAIGVRENRVTRLTKPFESNCSHGNHDPSETYTGLYTLLECNQRCLQKQIRSKCKCLDEIMDDQTWESVYASDSATSMLNPCSILNSTEEKCRQRMYYLSQTNRLGCDCPLPCLELGFEESLHSSEWPSAQYYPLMMQKLTDSNIISEGQLKIMNDLKTTRENFVRLHVYYKDMILESLEEFEAYTVDSLIGDIGGILGLFIGMSVLTIAEAVEYLIDLCLLRCKTNNKRNSVVALK
ncbi:unnamed protein product [Owenia fusiformis]|uniref:Uncharacterized protein n=1 Tax=Owenia fusiformis TaxID=6347 RepID=A0A8J1XS87_OWEFU|nr:unnamed protein product [Owenia fusiformis]